LLGANHKIGSGIVLSEARLIGVHGKLQVAVARGHPRFATENYKRTISKAEFDAEEYHKGLNLPNVAFVTRIIEQLIPVSHGEEKAN
jgi:hypothetical protein